MSAGVAAGLVFLVALAGLLLWAKPWKKEPETPITQPTPPQGGQPSV